MPSDLLQAGGRWWDRGEAGGDPPLASEIGPQGEAVAQRLGGGAPAGGGGSRGAVHVDGLEHRRDAPGVADGEVGGGLLGGVAGAGDGPQAAGAVEVGRSRGRRRAVVAAEVLRRQQAPGQAGGERHFAVRRLGRLRGWRPSAGAVHGTVRRAASPSGHSRGDDRCHEQGGGGGAEQRAGPTGRL